MTIPGHAIVRRTPAALAALIDDQVVVLSPRDLSYQAVDPIGANIWNRLAEPTALDDLISGLTSQYEVSDEQCRRDTIAFLERMSDLGVIEWS